ncbi:LTA synthase family protein [Jeotgalibaca sp. MA1X17-3]|uniref:LTA synthase family protein n=1 Tax=Jeotgalibaca sp. MA1X17-3 TaxID=2908211 RepID=UPI001F46E4EA|nr:LTA synthase family protein [Jeotgalibaca sp. MA1X17-3]UJF15518.1 LTA synthase family protein [Jeotgalibaca sp. MA1X17-3]
MIYIMNESFSDPFDLMEMNKNWDPIPFTRMLGETSKSGKMLSQGYGGGTANIEFEALTGLSMEPFSPTITTPFTQFLPKESDFISVVSRLKKDGHVATAIHPFDTSMYKRRDNYANLGFDDFYYNDTMKYTDKIENNPYISDESAYQEVLYRMEKTEGYDFVHLVTMQGHTPYDGKYTTTPSMEQTGFSKEGPNQYLQDLVYSDQAMEDFTQQLKKIEEPTVVVFWGDHWPNVFGESALLNNGEEVLHHTPVLIFSNQSSRSENLEKISPIYFFNEVLSLTNAKVTPFEAFLLELKEEIPAFEKGMYYEKEKGQYVQSREELNKEAQDILEEYDWIMYDRTVGDKDSVQKGFFDVNMK